MPITITGASVTGGALITVPNIATDPYFPYVPLLLEPTSTNAQTNNTFLDSSTNNFTITRNGTPTQGSLTPYWPNGQWSNYFNGSNSYLSVSDVSALQFGTGNFTIESWINFPSFATPQVILDQRVLNISHQLVAYVDTSGKPNIYIQIYPSNPNIIYNVTLSTNTWYHLAFVRNGNTMTCYVNGIAASNTLDVSLYNNTSSSTRIGVIGLDFSGYTKGYISNLRVVKGVAVYTGNFTPPITPLQITQSAGTNIAAITGTATSLLTCQSNRFIDNGIANSGTGFAITVSGTPQVQAFQPFSPTASYTAEVYGGSGYYSGTSGEYLNTVANAAFSFGTGDFTVEGWVFPTGAQVSNNMPIVEIRNSGGGAGFVLLRTANALTLNVYTNNGFAGVSTNSLTFNAWNHVALVRNSNVWYYYINGVASGSFANSSSQTDGATVGPKIGGSNASGPEIWIGYLSNIRIIKGVSVYTGAFTPPTLAPLTTAGSTSAASYPSTTNVNTSFASSATSLLLNYTNAGIYDAAVQNNQVTYGSAQVSTTVAKWGTTSMKFNGTTDYLGTLLGPNLQFGTGDFTVECWSYLVSRAVTQPAIFSNYNNYTTGALSLFAGHQAGSTTSYQVAINGATFPVIQGGTIVYNAWVHLAVVRYNGVISLYVNGTSVGTPYSTAVTLNGVGSSFYIGNTGDNIANGYINGYLQDFRVSKIARYTANFTVPTSAFPTQ